MQRQTGFSEQRCSNSSSNVVVVITAHGCRSRRCHCRTEAASVSPQGCALLYKRHKYVLWKHSASHSEEIPGLELIKVVYLFAFFSIIARKDGMGCESKKGVVLVLRRLDYYCPTHITTYKLGRKRNVQGWGSQLLSHKNSSFFYFKWSAKANMGILDRKTLRFY